MRRGDGREAIVLVAAHAARRGEPHVVVVALNDLPHQAGCEAVPLGQRADTAVLVQGDAAAAEARPHAVVPIREDAAALPAGFSGLPIGDERVAVPRQHAARRGAEPERIRRRREPVHAARLDVRYPLLDETAHRVAADELVGRHPHRSRAIGVEGARLGDGERLPAAAGETVQGLRGGDPDAAVGGDRRGSHAILVETVERARGLERVLGQAQQAAAHPDPDVVVAIAIERPGRAAHAMLVFDGLEQRVRAGRIRETEQAAAERGDQQPAAAVRNDAPARQREADAWVEAQGTRRVQLPDDPRAVRDPQVARIVFDQTVDVGGRAVDEVQLCAVVAIEAARGPDPHAAGAILVDAERLLAVVAVGVGHARPVVAGVAEQPVTGRCPQRAATILEERVDAGRCAVGGGIVRDAAAIDPGHAAAAVKGDPHATLRGTGERGQPGGPAARCCCSVPTAGSVCRRIGRDRLAYRARDSRRGPERSRTRRRTVRWTTRPARNGWPAERAGRRWQAPAGRRQRAPATPRGSVERWPEHESGRCCHGCHVCSCAHWTHACTSQLRTQSAPSVAVMPVYLADAGQGVP